MNEVCFPPFRLDLGTQRLWRGGEEVVLRAKTFAVLCYLAERAGRLVTKEELLEAIWPDTYVCDVAPMVCVWEIRKALGASGQELIATVHRRGYRFLGGAGPDQPADRAGRPAGSLGRIAMSRRDLWRERSSRRLRQR